MNGVEYDGVRRAARDGGGGDVGRGVVGAPIASPQRCRVLTFILIPWRHYGPAGEHTGHIMKCGA